MILGEPSKERRLTDRLSVPVVYVSSAKFFQAIVDDLVLRTGFAVVLPEYTLAPEEQFPVQQEQCLEVIEYIVQHGSSKGLATERIVTMGDCTGGIALTSPTLLVSLAPSYPVTHAHTCLLIKLRKTSLTI